MEPVYASIECLRFLVFIVHKLVCLGQVTAGFSRRWRKPGCGPLRDRVSSKDNRIDKTTLIDLQMEWWAKSLFEGMTP